MTASATNRREATVRRRYRSGLRERQRVQTRRAIVDAARDLFAANGWGATGMREIAVSAGVALETVYAHFSSKTGLLRSVADAAVVGDDAPVPLAERPEFQAIGRGSRPARVRAAARLLTHVHVRTAAVAKLLRQAAPSDEKIAEMLQSARERQRLDIGTAVQLMIGRVLTKSELDGLWALASPEVYLLLVEESGWTSDQYESWVAKTFERVIPRS